MLLQLRQVHLLLPTPNIQLRISLKPNTKPLPLSTLHSPFLRKKALDSTCTKPFFSMYQSSCFSSVQHEIYRCRSNGFGNIVASFKAVYRTGEHMRVASRRIEKNPYARKEMVEKCYGTDGVGGSRTIWQRRRQGMRCFLKDMQRGGTIEKLSVGR